MNFKRCDICKQKITMYYESETGVEQLCETCFLEKAKKKLKYEVYLI